MKKAIVTTLFSMSLIALTAPICLANSQVFNDESDFTASYQVAEAAPQQELNRDGAADAGGGNFHGKLLFDLYENEGSVELSHDQVRAFVKPYLDSLKTKVPELAKDLEEIITSKKWYLEPKALKQNGACKNASMFEFKLEVRACQSSVAVRMDKTFFQENPEVQSPLVMHELLVGLQLQNKKNKVSDEAVREMNRLLLNLKSSAEEIARFSGKENFGSHLTAEGRQSMRALFVAERKAYCSRRHYFGPDAKHDAANRQLNEFRDGLSRAGAYDQTEAGEIELDVLEKFNCESLQKKYRK